MLCVSLAIIVFKLAIPAMKWMKVKIFEYLMVDLKGCKKMLCLGFLIDSHAEVKLVRFHCP